MINKNILIGGYIGFWTTINHIDFTDSMFWALLLPILLISTWRENVKTNNLIIN